MTRFRTFAFALALAISLPCLVQAQSAMSSTTLGAAVANATTTTITVASTTGMTAGGPATGNPASYPPGGATFLYVDLEQMRVMRVISSTQVQVQRGLAGFPSAHANSATVYFGPGTAFKDVDPPIGQCDPASWTYSIWINVSNGNMSVCQYRGSDTTRKVYTVNSRLITFNSTPQVPPGT